MRSLGQFARVEELQEMLQEIDVDGKKIFENLFYNTLVSICEIDCDGIQKMCITTGPFSHKISISARKIIVCEHTLIAKLLFVLFLFQYLRRWQC